MAPFLHKRERNKLKARRTEGTKGERQKARYSYLLLMREWSDEELGPEIELVEMRVQQQRRRRVIAGVAVVVIVAMVGLFAFSDIWRANRNRPRPPDPIEFVET